MSSRTPSPSLASPLQLTAVQRAYLLFLGSFAAKAANNDAVALRQAWLLLPSIAKKLGVPAFELERSLLDALALTHIFVGVPKTIESLASVQETRRHDFDQPVQQPAADYLWPQEAKDKTWAHPDFSRVPVDTKDAHSSAVRRARATATLQAIYTTTVPNLERFLASLHPSLHFAIWSHGYGAMLCTPQLKLFEIETVAAAILSGTNTPRQLLSHLRGALHVGLPGDFLTQLLEEVYEDVWQDDGIYGESVQVWRDLQRTQRAKQSKEAGRPVDSSHEDQLAHDQAFEDQVKKAKRMADQGQQHPLYAAGQHVGHGEPDGVDIEDQLEAADRKTKRATPPAAPAPAAAAAVDPQPSSEEIDAAMRRMMKQRQSRIAAEAAERGPGARASVDDRWPIPTHMLDPAGMGMAGMTSGPAILQRGPPGFGGAGLDLRSRL